MTRRLVSILAVIGLGAGAVACERAGTRSVPASNLEMITAEYTDAIPLEYGELVSVTSDERHSAVLWFKQPDQSITAVRVNYSYGSMSKIVLSIPRR